MTRRRESGGKLTGVCQGEVSKRGKGGKKINEVEEREMDVPRIGEEIGKESRYMRGK